MRILIWGSGGREHALTWKLNRSNVVDKIYVYPGSPVQFLEAQALPVSAGASYKDVIAACLQQGIELVVVGPEQPLAEGFSDLCREEGLKVFGPCAEAAKLEASKNFAKNLMKEAGIPTAQFETVTSEEECRRVSFAMLERTGGVVVKASGLASGKGVFVCKEKAQLDEAFGHLFHGKMREAALEVVVEEVLEGRECSFFVMMGQGGSTPLGFAVDFKRLKDHDQGPNTGGMGCYTPVPWLPEDAKDQVMTQVVHPLEQELAKRGLGYVGYLYVGLMWGPSGPQVVEFNVRLGDPEAQVLAVHDERDWGQLICEKVGLRSESPWPPFDETKRSVCVVLASEGYPYGGKDHHHPSLPVDLFENKKGPVYGFGASLEQVSPGKLQVGSGRVLSFVSQGSSFGEARECVYQKVEALAREWPGLQVRRDIGKRADDEEQGR